MRGCTVLPQRPKFHLFLFFKLKSEYAFLKYLGVCGTISDLLVFFNFIPASPPTIPDLLHLSLADGRSVNLLQEVGTKYKPFGTLLLKDSTGSKMAAIEHTLGRNVQDINHRIVQDWLGGGGKTPVSWGSLVVVLQDVGMQVLAEAVRGVKCGGRRGAGGVGLDERMSNVMKVFR